MPWADETLNLKKAELIRKALDALVLLAPVTTTVPATIVDATGANLVIPTGFESLGNHSDDGLTWGREIENSDIVSHGSVDPSRSDIRRITSTLAVTAQETNLQTLQAHMGLDLSGIVPPVSGEVTFDEPTRPKTRYYRALSIAVDDGDGGEIYIGRLFARSNVTEAGEQTWSDGDEAMVRPLTLQAKKDAAAGFSVRHFFGGPGWNSILEDMGFPPKATS